MIEPSVPVGEGRSYCLLLSQFRVFKLFSALISGSLQGTGSHMRNNVSGYLHTRWFDDLVSYYMSPSMRLLYSGKESYLPVITPYKTVLITRIAILLFTGHNVLKPSFVMCLDKIIDPYRVMDLITSGYRWCTLLSGPPMLDRRQPKRAATPSTKCARRMKLASKFRDRYNVIPRFFRYYFTLILSPCRDSRVRGIQRVLGRPCTQMSSLPLAIFWPNSRIFYLVIAATVVFMRLRVLVYIFHLRL